MKPIKPPDLKKPLPTILVIEDERDVAATLKRVIESCGDYDTHIQIGAEGIEDVLARLRPELVFTDLMMPGLNGFEVIQRAKELDADLPVVVVSAYATLENAVAAVKAGAFDFLPKPFSPESVELILAKVKRDRELRDRAAEANRRMQTHDPDLRALLGESLSMKQLREWIVKVRGVRANVLIEGESGTGKELVARAIHADNGPFVAVNAATVPDNLAESELFGYCKGAFTGAQRDRAGLLAEANGGTLFLDEINAMSPALQAKLLRVLEERRMRPLGGNSEMELDFRLISASNRDLEAMVEHGEFRRDLYHRVKVLHGRIPPLAGTARRHPLAGGTFSSALRPRPRQPGAASFPRCHCGAGGGGLAGQRARTRKHPGTGGHPVSAGCQRTAGRSADGAQNP